MTRSSVLLLTALILSFAPHADASDSKTSDRISGQIKQWASATRKDFATTYPDADAAIVEKPIYFHFTRTQLIPPSQVRIAGKPTVVSEASRYAAGEDQLRIRPELDHWPLPYMRFSFRRAMSRSLLRRLLAPTLEDFQDLPAWQIEAASCQLAADGEACDNIATRSLLLPLIALAENKLLLPLDKLVGKTQRELARSTPAERQAFRAQAWGLLNCLKRPPVRELGSIQRLPEQESLALRWQNYLQALLKPGATPIDPNHAFASMSSSQLSRNLRKWFDTTSGRTQTIESTFAGAPVSVVPIIQKMLKHKKATRRALAAQVAGVIGERSLLDALTKMSVRDKDKMVRCHAADAVGRLNYGVSPERWLDDLRHKDRAEPALEAIRRIGDRGAVRRILELVYTVRHYAGGGGPNAYMRVGTTSNYISRYSQQGDVFVPEIGTYDQGVTWSVKVIKSQTWRARLTAINVLDELVDDDVERDLKQWQRWGRNLPGVY